MTDSDAAAVPRPEQHGPDPGFCATGNFARCRAPSVPAPPSRGQRTQTPRLLVVLELPADESQWMTVTREELVLRRRAYWLSLQQGHDES